MTRPSSFYLSHSQVETLTDCGEKYRLSRVVGVPEAPAMWNAGGRAFHSAAEHFEREQFLAGTPSIEETLEVFHQIFEDEVSQAEHDWHEQNTGVGLDPEPVPWRIANRGKEDDAWWREHGAGMVRAYVLQSEEDQTELVATPDGQPAVEVEFMVTIAGVPFKGFIDQVRKLPSKRALITRDLKAGARTPTSTTQLGEYGVSLELLWGEEAAPYALAQGEYYMARTARTTARLQLARAHPRVSVEYAIATAWFMKNGGLFLPRPSAFCKSCAVSAFCLYQNGERANEVPAPSPPRIG